MTAVYHRDELIDYLAAPELFSLPKESKIHTGRFMIFAYLLICLCSICACLLCLTKSSEKINVVRAIRTSLTILGDSFLQMHQRVLIPLQSHPLHCPIE